MHKFSSGSRACSPGKFLNLNYLNPGLWGDGFYRILIVRRRHCCSIGYSLSLGAPLGLGAPGYSRSEPIVVTPLCSVLSRSVKLTLMSVFVETPSIVPVITHPRGPRWPCSCRPGLFDLRISRMSCARSTYLPIIYLFIYLFIY
jgi:hypothetical protein